MFFSLYRGAWWKDSDNGSQTGGGNNSGQNHSDMVAFFKGKIMFMITFKEQILCIFTSLVSKGHM